MPRLGGDAGLGGLVGAVTLHKAVPGRRPAERPAHPVIGEGRADKVDLVGGFGQVDGQAGLVLAAAGQGHIAAGESLALFSQRIVPDGLLFFAAAPAGHRDDAPRAAHRTDAGGQHLGGLLLHQDLRESLVRRGQRDGKPALQRVLPVDKRQRPDACGGKVRQIARLVDDGGRCFHACCTPSSIMRVISVPKSRPIAFIMLG